MALNTSSIIFNKKWHIGRGILIQRGLNYIKFEVAEKYT